MCPEKVCTFLLCPEKIWKFLKCPETKSLVLKLFYWLEHEKIIEYDFCPHREYQVAVSLCKIILVNWLLCYRFFQDGIQNKKSMLVGMLSKSIYLSIYLSIYPSNLLLLEEWDTLQLRLSNIYLYLCIYLDIYVNIYISIYGTSRWFNHAFSLTKTHTQ